MKCWGANYSGVPPYNSRKPVDIPGLSSGVTAISAGSTHTCAIMATGRVQCWGSNHYGALGNGLGCPSTDTDPIDFECSEYSGTPVEVKLHGVENTPLSGALKISGGSAHSCAILDSSEVWCWGMNDSAQLGLGLASEDSWPLFVRAASRVVRADDSTEPFLGALEIAAGEQHTCALTASGGVKCWGWADVSFDADGFPVLEPAPVDVVGLGSGVAQLDAGGLFPCVVLTNGGVRCWGLNGYGQLGNGTTTSSMPPVIVSGTP